MCKTLTVHKDIQQDSIQVSYRTVLYWTIIPQHNHLMEICKMLTVYKDLQQYSIQVSFRTVLYWTIFPQHKHLIEMCKTLIVYIYNKIVYKSVTEQFYTEL